MWDIAKQFKTWSDSTVWLQNALLNLNKNEKYFKQPLKRKWTSSIDEKKSIMPKWVNQTTCHFMVNCLYLHNSYITFDFINFPLAYLVLCQLSVLCLPGFRQSDTQTSLLSFKDKLENWNFACSKFRYNSFQNVNKKGDDQSAQADLHFCCSQTPQDRFSRIKAHIYDAAGINSRYFILDKKWQDKG